MRTILMIGEILLTALITALILAVEHWMPWELALRKKLPRLAAYTMGVGGIVAPLSVLYWCWASDPPGWRWAHLAALLAVTFIGGLSVLFAHFLDRLLAQLSRADELMEILDQRDGRKAKEN